MVVQSSPLEVFCSYAHQDEVWLHKLVTHLRLLEREGLVLIWHDRLLTPGTDWAQEIDEHLNRARLILLLISPDFVASDYCYGIEMQHALKRHEANEARVIPILVRPVGNWQDAPFARLQALPPGKFLVEWSEREEDIPLAQIATGIHAALKEQLSSATSLPCANQPTIWNVPYMRNALFTGREAELDAIEMALSTGQRAAIVQAQAISGLGGMGKTQLALEYIYRHRADYRSVFWVQADTRNTLNAAYSKIADLLNLPELQQREQHVVVEAVKDWLAKHQGWLLVLDNADDLALVHDFLPISAFGHLLLTTRAHAMGQLAVRIEVKKLDVEEGSRFLLHRSGLLGEYSTLENADPAARSAAREIVREVDGLPLALDQAGAYIEETTCGLQGYLELYRAQRAELLRLRGGLLADHPEPVATTWHLAFERVESDSAAAADLLRLCAFLAPDDIPEAIIGKGVSQLTRPLKKIAGNPLQLNAALAALQRYSLVTRHPDAHTLNIHRLVQAVLRDAMPKKVERAWAKRTVQAMVQLFPWPEIANWEVCRQLLPHVQACAALIERWPMELGEGTTLLSSAGLYLRERGEYHEAQRYLEQALAIYRAVLGEQHSSTAASFNNLANVYRVQGKYPEAEGAHQQALAIRRAALGEQHPDTADSFNNLANVYADQEKYEQAEGAHQQALAIRRAALGEQHPDTAISLSNLAVVYEAQGRYPEAEGAHQQALAIRRAALGEQHPDTAHSLEGLAVVYEAQEKSQQAEAAHQQALAIYRVVLGEQHPDTAAILNNLAVVYRNQKKDEEALPLFEQALAIFQEKLGPTHPKTKNVQSNYEKTLQATKHRKM